MLKSISLFAWNSKYDDILRCNTTFDRTYYYYPATKYLNVWFGLWSLMPLSTIFQL